jgi:hypothetical protein
VDPPRPRPRHLRIPKGVSGEDVGRVSSYTVAATAARPFGVRAFYRVTLSRTRLPTALDPGRNKLSNCPRPVAVVFLVPPSTGTACSVLQNT